MPLRVGDLAPAFSALDQAGRRRSRAEWDGRPFVLYFYPKDETPGCIAEGCGFRDEWDAFLGAGVDVVGVSRDSVASHAAFAANRKFPFTLLADEDGAITRAYKAQRLGGLLSMPRRVSYFVDAKGQIAAVHESEVDMRSHVDAMLEAAKRRTSR